MVLQNDLLLECKLNMHEIASFSLQKIAAIGIHDTFIVKVLFGVDLCIFFDVRECTTVWGISVNH